MCLHWPVDYKSFFLIQIFLLNILPQKEHQIQFSPLGTTWARQDIQTHKWGWISQIRQCCYIQVTPKRRNKCVVHTSAQRKKTNRRHDKIRNPEQTLPPMSLPLTHPAPLPAHYKTQNLHLMSLTAELKDKSKTKTKTKDEKDRERKGKGVVK